MSTPVGNSAKITFFKIYGIISIVRFKYKILISNGVNMWLKVKDFWSKYESKIILILGFILVASLAFEAGILKGQKIRENPIIIEKLAQNQDNVQTTPNAPEAQNLAPDAKNTSIGPNIPDQTMSAGKQDCTFVGSKNSNKYHLPTCRWAKQIKPENLVCFKDVDEAKSKGYLPDKNCIK